ncbi:endonuclease/exonuclease/phosphatase family protein [Limisphaera sp. VF-2]|jgi:endonuclease/exonuclease/phosphatase family metal-dependent hydrolase|uniref:endonuclease/exonuclease/phosphatase family protein n=1 Tax=Limisphaera sp. VF-2 TaxID=3400418 RepID=UPI0017585F9A
MQNLWRLILLLCVAVSAAQGGIVKVLTWNLEWLPSGVRSGRASLEVEQAMVASVAPLLKALNADILVLQEVRDLKACQDLVRQLTPLTYEVAVCSQLSEFAGLVGQQQIAILSRPPANAAWFDNWRTFALADPPRGFSFAAFRLRTNDIGVYGIHLKSNLSTRHAEPTHQFNILKRELAAEQLMAHIPRVSTQLSTEVKVLIVAGDFNTTLDQPVFASESTLTLLYQNGFASGLEELPFPQRITIPGKGEYPPATFDYAFAKPAVIAGKAAVTYTSTSHHHPVTRTISLQ